MTNEFSRTLFYDVMQLVFIEVDEFSSYAKSSLIKGLSDPSKEIRENIVAFWNDSGKLSNDPSTRLEMLMNDLYACMASHMVPIWRYNGLNIDVLVW